MKYWLPDLIRFLLCVLVGFAFVAVILLLWGCRSSQTITDVSRDSIAVNHTEYVNNTHTAYDATNTSHWGDKIQTIILSEAGDTVRYIEKVCIRDTLNKVRVDTITKYVIKSDTVTQSKNHYINKVVEKKMTTWEQIKLKFFNWILVCLLIVILSLTIYISTRSIITRLKL